MRSPRLRPGGAAVLAAVLLVSLGGATAAQAPDLSALHEMQRRAGLRTAQGDVLGALALTRAVDGSLALSGLAESWNRQQVIELLAAVGLHRESLALLRKHGGVERDREPTSAEEKRLAIRAHLQPAMESLLQVARKRQVLMLNEEHWRPEHRAFGAALIPRLRHLGFRYLALEARDQAPLDEAKRTGRVSLDTDPYCHDPQRANLLRAALRSGMKIVAFDVSDPEQLALMRRDPLAGVALREDWMAENIQTRILKQDPQAKILVWVGMGHIAKKPLELQGKPVEFMALRFWKRTGIEPYCVNQISDTGDPETDRRVYRLLIREAKPIKEPVFYPNPNASAPDQRVRTPSLYGVFDGAGLDALVLHPLDPVETDFARPRWQCSLQAKSFPGRLSQQLAWYDPSARYLLQALDTADGPRAAATDQVTAAADGRFTLRIFPDRTYRLRVWKLNRGETEATIVLERPLPDSNHKSATDDKAL